MCVLPTTRRAPPISTAAAGQAPLVQRSVPAQQDFVCREHTSTRRWAQQRAAAGGATAGGVEQLGPPGEGGQAGAPAQETGRLLQHGEVGAEPPDQQRGRVLGVTQRLTL